jgi:polysaccharide deacetylase family protein (PEP-CTERM system associated)
MSISHRNHLGRLARDGAGWRAKADGNGATDAADGVAVSAYFGWNDALNRIAAAILLGLFLPLVAILVVLVRLTSRGPGIYRQVRLGRGGCTFEMYKLRTMKHDAESATGPVWCTPGDSRITRLGRFLRNYHLDEFPQLYNVIRGDMSLVGPRPERPEIARSLKKSIPDYMKRLAVKPGITGLAQLNLPPDTDLDSVRRKLVLDLEYVATAGLWLDARLLFCTIARLVKLPALRALGLHREVCLPPRLESPGSEATEQSAQFGEDSPGKGAETLNAFTVDVEDYFQVSAFEREIDRDHWDHYASRVEANTQRMLKLLDRHNTRGTFFVLGWVADRYPHLVREIQACGHEIGSHGYWHRLVYEGTADQFRADIRRSKDVLEDILGDAVTAYRAPSFSVIRKSLWALDILAEEGFRIDSSIFPIRHDRYGIPDANPRIHQIATQAGPLWEFPASVVRCLGTSVPVSGGGYFRLLPLAVTLRCLAHINRVCGVPFIFYVHPWEIDPGQPRLPIRSRLSRFRHYVHLDTTERKLSRLLSRFRFGTVGQVVRSVAGASAVAPVPRAIQANAAFAPLERAWISESP